MARVQVTLIIDVPDVTVPEGETHEQHAQDMIRIWVEPDEIIDAKVLQDA